MRYEYSTVPMDEVLENPGEYIIPECLDACRILWDKGIETFMCSNYNNEVLYISINDLSLDDHNREILWENLDNNPSFYIDPYNNAPSFRGQTSEELVELAKVFDFQDSGSYLTNDQILNSYKRGGHANYEILDTGAIILTINPARKNATLEEALRNTNLDYYDEKEGKLFISKFALEHHKKYQAKMKLQQ